MHWFGAEQVPHVLAPPHPLDAAPQERPLQFGLHPHVPAVPLPPHVFGEVHFVPQPPQLELSVLKLVQALLQKFGLLAVEQTQLPAEQVLPVVVQFTQLDAEPQLSLSFVLS